MSRAVIVGAGPAGALLGLLLARWGVEVALLERQADFHREFRGELLMPSGLGVFREVGLDRPFAAVPQRPLERLEAFRGARRLFEVDVRAALAPGGAPHAVSQPALLEMLVAEASRLPTFRFERGAAVQGLIVEGDRVAGVRAALGEGEEEFRGDLVIGCDGRFSLLRTRSGLHEERAPQSFDVIWCKVSAPPGLPPGTGRLYLGHGHFAVAFPSYDGRLQIGWIIDKGSFGDLKRRGVGAWLEDLEEHVSPDFAAHLRGCRGEAAHPFLLSVLSDRLERWTRPGLLLLGDAAHPMSPVGGQGLNMALRDAVVAANHLGPALTAGKGVDEAAVAVQEERLKETRSIQERQARVPRVIFAGGWRTRLLIDTLAPLLARVGLAQRFLRSNVRAFAFGEAEVRYVPPPGRQGMAAGLGFEPR